MKTVLDLKLPETWEWLPLKFATRFLNRGTAPDYSDDGAVRAISQAANKPGGLDWSRTRFHNYSGDPRALKGYLMPGDLLINSTGTGTLGRVGYFTCGPDEMPCVADGHITVARSDENRVDSRYLYYWMSCKPLNDFIYSALVVGATNQIELSRERLAAAPVALPPPDEQRRIAAFLDAETARIDSLRSAQYRIVDLLEERANTRILDLMGASALGSRDGTPIVPIKRALRKLTRATKPTDEVITAFRDGQVTARSYRRADGYTLTAGSEPQGQGVAVGDVVVHGLDGFAGAIGDSEAAGNCSPVYHVCRPIGDGNAVFYGRLLRVLAVTNYLGLFATSIRERAFDFRNWGLFGSIPIPVVDTDIQQDIGRQIADIRPVRERVDRFNSLLTERRQALITATVTGQFDVTSARGHSTASAS